MLMRKLLVRFRGFQVAVVLTLLFFLEKYTKFEMQKVRMYRVFVMCYCMLYGFHRLYDNKDCSSIRLHNLCIHYLSIHPYIYLNLPYHSLEVQYNMYNSYAI